MPCLLPNVDPDGLLEFSVVYTICKAISCSVPSTVFSLGKKNLDLMPRIHTAKRKVKVKTTHLINYENLQVLLLTFSGSFSFFLNVATFPPLTSSNIYGRFSFNF